VDLTLSDFLIKNSIDPATTLALRHSPTERSLAEVFPMLITSEHDTFNTYQSVQTLKVEKQMDEAKHVAAFYALPKEHGVFIGLYEQRGSRTTTKAELEAMRTHQALVRFGMGQANTEARPTMLLFDLQEMKAFAGYQGRIVVRWPKPPVQWSRWANREFPITAIHEENLLQERMGAWDEISLTCAKIKMCPPSWIRTLSGYPGIYFIFDRTLQKGYVGAAYGPENIWQRWSRHAALGGDARELKRSNPDDFVFSILQLVGPSTPKEEVEKLEASWKRRLHTRDFGLNAN
jgi:hypothetical protein